MMTWHCWLRHYPHRAPSYPPSLSPCRHQQLLQAPQGDQGGSRGVIPSFPPSAPAAAISASLLLCRWRRGGRAIYTYIRTDRHAYTVAPAATLCHARGDNVFKRGRHFRSMGSWAWTLRRNTCSGTVDMQAPIVCACRSTQWLCVCACLSVCVVVEKVCGCPLQ